MQGQHHVHIDNFDLIAKFINAHPGNFFFVQVIKRRKDNPHAGIHYAKYLQFWEVKTAKDLYSLKNIIHQFSQKNNARVYIRMNQRDLSKCINRAPDFIGHPKPYAKAEWDVAFQKAAGWRFDSPNFDHSFPWTLIDIDTRNPHVMNGVKQTLHQHHINTPIIYKTPNGGMHIFTTNRTAVKKLKQQFVNQYGTDSNGNPIVAVDPDGATLLYADIIAQGY